MSKIIRMFCRFMAIRIKSKISELLSIALENKMHQPMGLHCKIAAES